MNNFTITAVGDCLITRKIPKEYIEKNPLKDFINIGDIRLANLETTIVDDDYFGSAYSGGTWVKTERKVIDSLLNFNFNFFGCANNHSMDYSYDGLLSTINNLKDIGIGFSGIGKNLTEASDSGKIETSSTRVGIISVSSTFNMAAMAGKSSEYIKGRPGLNYLRRNEEFIVSTEQMRILKEIADKTGINREMEIKIAGGFEKPIAKNLFPFGPLRFSVGKANSKKTYCNVDDLKRIEQTIKDTLMVCDNVIVMIHSHESKDGRLDLQEDFLEEFAHFCISSGASAIIGTGAHELRGIEIYNRKPIFYSLGNFIFQNSYVNILPPDFMQKLGFDEDISAQCAIKKRSILSNGNGLDQRKENYLSVIPLIEFENNECKNIILKPVRIKMIKEGHSLGGLPFPSDFNDTKIIIEKLQKLSARFGTMLTNKGTEIKVEMN